MVKLKPEQMKEVQTFIETYEQLNISISSKEKDLKHMKEVLELLLNELKNIREREKEWNKQQSKELNITYEQYSTLTKNYAMNISRIKNG